MTFCVTKRFQRKSHFTRKIIINKKYYNVRTSVFHFIKVLVSCTQRVFKFCPRNQSAEEASHFTLLQFTICRKRKRKNCIIRVCSFRNHIATNSTRFQKYVKRKMSRKIERKHLLQIKLVKDLLAV